MQRTTSTLQPMQISWKKLLKNLEPARNVIHEEYGQTQACVEETKR